MGFGGIAVRIEAQTTLHQGEQVQGVIHLTGGSVAQQVDGVAVLLVRYWTSTDSEGHEGTESKTVLKQQIKADGLLQPGESMAVPFRLALPVGIGVSSNGEWWKLEACVDVPGAIDPSGTLDVSLQPPRRVLELYEAVTRELGWQRRDIVQTGKPEGSVRLLCLPPQQLKGAYDDMRLNVLVNSAGSFDVCAVMNLKEKGALDYLRAALNMDLKEESFAATDIGEVLARLRALIDKYR